MKVDRLFNRRRLASAITTGCVMLGVPTALLAGNAPDSGALVPIRHMEAAPVPTGALCENWW